MYSITKTELDNDSYICDVSSEYIYYSVILGRFSRMLFTK